MTVSAGKGSGVPRIVAGEIALHSKPEAFESDMAAQAALPDKHFKSAAARAASLAQLAKSPSKGTPVPSAKAVPMRLPNGLTLRQEQFAQNVMAGMSHAQAYRDAYNCHNLKPAVVYNRAYSVAINPRVRARTEALWAEREGRLSHTPAQLRLFVQERLHLEATNPDNPAGVRVRALELIGKIGRVKLFEPEQQEGEKNQDVASILKRLGPLLAAGNALALQHEQANKPTQSR